MSKRAIGVLTAMFLLAALPTAYVWHATRRIELLDSLVDTRRELTPEILLNAAGRPAAVTNATQEYGAIGSCRDASRLCEQGYWYEVPGSFSHWLFGFDHEGTLVVRQKTSLE